MTRIEEIQRALSRAQAAGDAPAVAEIQAMLDAERALEGQRFNEQTGFALEPKTQQEIDRAQGRAVREAEDFWAEREVGALDLAGQGLASEAEALPSGVMAGYLSGQAAGLRRDKEGGIWAPDGITSYGTFGLLDKALRQASTLTPDSMVESLEQSGQENLQETLAIRQRNALETQALKDEYLRQGGSEFGADLALGVGSSASSFLPQIGAVGVGLATRSPTAALATQRVLGVIPATQAYAGAYAEFKKQYPDAPEEEAQRYAAASAGLEYAFEFVPGGAGQAIKPGIGSVLSETAKRTAREATFEAGTEANQQLLQRAIAPELAPETAGDAGYNIGLAAATAGVVSGPVNLAGAVGDARTPLAPPPVKTGDPVVDSGAEAAAQIQASVAGEAPVVEAPTTRAERVAQQATTQPLPVTRLMEQLDTRLQELDTLSTEGRLTRQEMQALDREEVELRSILQEQEAADRSGVLPADPTSRLSQDERMIATNRLQEISTQRERARAAQGYSFKARDIRESLSKIDNDNDLVAFATRALEAPDVRVETQPETIAQEAPVTTVEATEVPPAPTPQPTTQTAPTRAERAATVEAATASTTNTTTVDVLNPQTGRTAEQVAETAIAPDDPERIAVEQEILRDAQTAALTKRAVAPDVEAAARMVLNRTRPPEQRQSTPLRQALSRATTAWDALAGVRAAVSRGADPKIERYDRLIQALSTPDMKEVGFKVLQPETEATTQAQRNVKEGVGIDAYTKGLFEYNGEGGRPSVTVTGDGFPARDGTASVEITLHEIVHAKTAKAINDVKNRVEQDERVVKAVQTFENIRGEVRRAKRDSLTKDEAEAIDYSTSNTDEFLSGTMTNPLVQSALKKKGFWSQVVNTIRIMLRMPRSQKAVLDEVLDAAYAVVDAINTVEKERASGTRKERVAQPTAEQVTPRPERFPPVEVDLGNDGGVTPLRANTAPTTQPTSYRERVLGKGTQTRPMRTTSAGMFMDRVSRELDSWFSAHKGGTKETTEAKAKAQGVVQRTLAELQVAVARMDKQLRSVRTGPKAELAREYLGAKPDKKPAIAKKLNDTKLVDALDRSRGIIDNLSDRLQKELVASYAGRDMPQSVLNLLKTIKKNIGSYTTRAYLVDLEPGSARTLWGDYKRGDAQAKERLQPLVDMVTGKLEGLGSWLEGARQEAELLSDTRLQFNPEETQFGRELRQRYGDFIGNPGTKTKAELFRDLEKFVSDLKKEDFDKQRDNAVQKMLGVFEDDGTADALSSYYRGMRGDDRTLRQRENVPPELRKAWGEILDPILTVQLTANRSAAALAGIQASNFMVDEFPNLFTPSVDGDTNRIKQIPNNGVAYGKAAGMYTTPEVFEFMTASAATMSLFDASKDATGNIVKATKWAIGAARGATSTAKLMMIAFNVTTQTALSSLNFVAMPLTNGHFNMKRLPEAIKLSKRLVGTSYRTSDMSPELLEVIEQGVIDPVQLRVDEEARSQEKENRLLASARQGGSIAQQWVGVLREKKNQVVSQVIEPVRETVSFFEVAPKVFNYLAAKDELKAAYPEMSDAEVVRLAAEQTNRLNPTYARTRNIVGAAETVGVSYTANYMEQIASTTARSLKMGYDQAKLGIQSGDTPLALMGLRKLMGVASVAGLSYMMPAMVQGLFGLEESEEDELIKANLPFVERGMQPVIIDSDGEFIRYFDAGRLNPYDTVHAPMRAIISAVANLTSGNTEEASRDLEGATKNLAGQFAGGSPLGQAVVSLATNTPRTNTLENDLPGLYSWLVTTAGGDKQAAGLASSAYVMGTPSIARSFVSTLSRYLKEEPGPDREAFLEDKVNSLTAIGVPVRTANANQNMSFQASNMARARTEASTNLGNILLVPGNLSDEEIEVAVDDYLTSQLEPFADAKQVVEARRALGRRQGESQRVTDAAIREALKADKISGDNIEALLSDKPYTPLPLADSFAEQRAQRRAQRDTQRSERARLETLYNERIEKAQRMVNERVRSWANN